MVVTLDQQYNVGEKPTVILCTYINRHARTDTTHNINIIVVLHVNNSVVYESQFDDR